MKQSIAVMSSFLPLRPGLGCWPVVGVGDRGFGIGREMTLCGVQLSQEGSPTSLPTDLPTTRGKLVFASRQDCYFWVPITRFYDKYWQELMIFMWHFTSNSWKGTVSRLRVCHTVSSMLVPLSPMNYCIMDRERIIKLSFPFSHTLRKSLYESCISWHLRESFLHLKKSLQFIIVGIQCYTSLRCPT